MEWRYGCLPLPPMQPCPGCISQAGLMASCLPLTPGGQVLTILWLLRGRTLKICVSSTQCPPPLIKGPSKTPGAQRDLPEMTTAPQPDRPGLQHDPEAPIVLEKGRRRRRRQQATTGGENRPWEAGGMPCRKCAEAGGAYWAGPVWGLSTPPLFVPQAAAEHGRGRLTAHLRNLGSPQPLSLSPCLHLPFWVPSWEPEPVQVPRSNTGRAT